MAVVNAHSLFFQLGSFSSAAFPLVPSFLGFAAAYHFLAPLYSTSKQRSWILTTIASMIVTLASLPFVSDYILSQGNVGKVRSSSRLAYTICRVFQAYLLCDISMGLLYYRKQVGLLTGWIHHSLYVCIVEVAIRGSWPQIFCLAGMMELPTFILAIASIYPVLRSDITFALAFFTTRILLHVILFVSYLLPRSRMQATGGSFVPAITLGVIFPLHALWFKGCVAGFIKRRQKALAAAEAEEQTAATVIHLEIACDRRGREVSKTTKVFSNDVPPIRRPTVALNSDNTSNKENVPPSLPSDSSPVNRQSRFRVRRGISSTLIRRLSFEKALRKVEVETAKRHLEEARRLVYEALPDRDRVFDYFGIGNTKRGMNGIPTEYERVPGTGVEAPMAMGRTVYAY